MPDDADDLLIRVGRLCCPTTGLDGAGAVVVRGGRIVRAGGDISGAAKRELEFPNGVLLPGLIDLHAHPAKSGSVFGVDPDRFMLPRGTTSVASQGDAGAANQAAYCAETIDQSQTRVLLAMNLSRIGESTEEGCFERLDDADVKACVEAVGCCRGKVWGIAVNVSAAACGRTDPHAVLARGLSAARETGLPLLFGMRGERDWPLADQLSQLRPGDVVTYCFRRTPHCIVRGGRVLPEIHAARARGILFDVGHGAASFDFAVAEAALRDGFPPDTISTDLQRRHEGNFPQHDLPLTMSKLRAVGMPDADIFSAVTSVPASVLGIEESCGTLSPGAEADLCVLEWRDDAQSLCDTSGQRRSGGCWNPAVTVRAGELFWPGSAREKRNH